MRLLILFLLLYFFFVMPYVDITSESQTVVVEEVILTERQKEILRKLELPEEYDELTTRQANGIVNIEDMLTYLEEKYDEEFKYLEYSDGWYGGEMYLEAYPVRWGSHRKVTVTKVGYDEETGYEYEDDFPCILYESAYEDALEEFVSQYFDMEYCKVYADLSYTAEDITDENVLSKSSANIYIYLDDSRYDVEDMNNFMDDYSQWLWEQSAEVGSHSRIFLFAGEAFDEVNSATAEYKTMDHDNIRERIDCDITNTQPVNIF